MRGRIWPPTLDWGMVLGFRFERDGVDTVSRGTVQSSVKTTSEIIAQSTKRFPQIQPTTLASETNYPKNEIFQNSQNMAFVSRMEVLASNCFRLSAKVDQKSKIDGLVFNEGWWRYDRALLAKMFC